MKKPVSAGQLTELAHSAAHSERGRMHLNTHDSLDANVQRLFIATMPDTYIRPHRHTEAHKWEFFVILEGSMDLLIFGDDSELRERVRLSRTDSRAIEVPPGTWHSYVCLEAGTLALEVKEGAYTPSATADFASWAPAEGAHDVEKFLGWMRSAKIGGKQASR